MFEERAAAGERRRGNQLEYGMRMRPCIFDMNGLIGHNSYIGA